MQLYMYLISGNTRRLFVFIDFWNVLAELDVADSCAHLMESRLTAAVAEVRGASFIFLRCWLSTPNS